MIQGIGLRSFASADRLGFARLRFWSVAALLFICTAFATLELCNRMAEMGEMPMPGGWSMSMMWMRMPGQSWPGAAVSFMAMWTPMMIAMMLPTLTIELWTFRTRLPNGSNADALTLAVATGYVVAWTATGLVFFGLGCAVAEVEMRSAAIATVVPFAAGLIVLFAGGLQFTGWKSRQLHCCRETLRPTRSATLIAAWKDGLRLGLRCVYCCAPLTAILLVLGMMDRRSMILVTLAITVERLHNGGRRAAHAVGSICVSAGIWLIYRAAL